MNTLSANSPRLAKIELLPFVISSVAVLCFGFRSDFLALTRIRFEAAGFTERTRSTNRRVATFRLRFTDAACGIEFLSALALRGSGSAEKGVFKLEAVDNWGGAASVTAISPTDRELFGMEDGFGWQSSSDASACRS
jgi:hypothetical protein